MTDVVATTTAPFAQELQALKAELQRTLARLGGATRRSATPVSPWSQASATTSASTMTTTPTTVRSDAASGRSPASPAHSDTTERILHELVATARRRRQVEMHMARELERESRSRDNDEEPALMWGPRHAGRDAVDERERAIRSEIEALRLRRKQVLHEIDCESKNDDRTRVSTPLLSQRTDATQSDHSKNMQEANVSNVSASIKRQGENEYSIEGTVKLGSLLIESSNQEPRRRASPNVPHTEQPQRRPPSIHFQPSAAYGSYRPHHQDMMQDVFAIQLKFAETMLQLEKSIQARDQLLIPVATDRVRRRSTASRRNVTLRRRARQPSTIHEELERDPADTSDDEPADSRSLGILSSDEASMSEDTMRLWRRYRLNGHDRQRTPTMTARAALNMAASGATTTTSTSPNSQPSPQTNDSETAASPPLASNEPTPSESAHLTTPSTNESANKQVRFNELEAGHTDEYPTPLIARNISFDQDSIDSSDDDHALTTRRALGATFRPAYPPRTRCTVVSSDDEALSFLEGSSVCTADLNDESFLTAFDALRRELQGDRSCIPHTPLTNMLKPTTRSLDEVAAFPEVKNDRNVQDEPAAVDLVALKQQKRGLTLDLQALTAKLVLAQDATQRSHASAALDRLRRQLRTIEAQEAAAAANK